MVVTLTITNTVSITINITVILPGFKKFSEIAHRLFKELEEDRIQFNTPKSEDSGKYFYCFPKEKKWGFTF